MALQDLSAEQLAQLYERIRPHDCILDPVAPGVFPIIPLRPQLKQFYPWPASLSTELAQPGELGLVIPWKPRNTPDPFADLVETIVSQAFERRLRAHMVAVLQEVIRDDTSDEMRDDTALPLAEWNAKVDALLAECQLEDRQDGCISNQI